MIKVLGLYYAFFQIFRHFVSKICAKFFWIYSFCGCSVVDVQSVSFLMSQSFKGLDASPFFCVQCSFWICLTLSFTLFGGLSLSLLPTWYLSQFQFDLSEVPTIVKLMYRSHHPSGKEIAKPIRI